MLRPASLVVTALVTCAPAGAQDAAQILGRVTEVHTSGEELAPYRRAVLRTEIDKVERPGTRGTEIFLSPRRFVTTVRGAGPAGDVVLSVGRWEDTAWVDFAGAPPTLLRGADADSLGVLGGPVAWRRPLEAFSDCVVLDESAVGQAAATYDLVTMRGGERRWMAVVAKESGALVSLTSDEFGSITLAKLEEEGGRLVPVEVEVRFDQEIVPGHWVARRWSLDLGPHEFGGPEDLKEAALALLPTAIRQEIGESKAHIGAPRMLAAPADLAMRRPRIEAAGLEGLRAASREAYHGYWRERLRRLPELRRKLEGTRRAAETQRARGLSDGSLSTQAREFEREIAELERPVPAAEVASSLARGGTFREAPYVLFLADLTGGEDPDAVRERLTGFETALSWIPDGGPEENARIRTHVQAVAAARSAIEAGDLAEAQRALDEVWSWVLGG